MHVLSKFRAVVQRDKAPRARETGVMFSRFFGKRGQEAKGSDWVIESDDETETSSNAEDSTFMQNLKLNMSKMIAYTQSADVKLQREVAELLANEAVNSDRQVQIVEYGGLKLLVPLTKSTDDDVKRLAAHALANLSVNSENQVKMAKEGAIDLLIILLKSQNEVIQRQASKAVANMGVNSNNKALIGQAGAIPPLIALAKTSKLEVKIEAIAALGNLSVNDQNELEIVKEGVLEALEGSAAMALRFLLNFRESGRRRDRECANWEELAAQSARCIRNLTVNPVNREKVIDSGVIPVLKEFATFSNERISQQSSKALKNISGTVESKKKKAAAIEKKKKALRAKDEEDEAAAIASDEAAAKEVREKHEAKGIGGGAKDEK